MRFDVVTLFPELVAHAAGFGVTGRALERGLWQLGTWNPRDFTQDNHRTVDDRPYGGGPGMVMLPEPLEKALGGGARGAAGARVRRDADDPPHAGRSSADARARRGARGGGGFDRIRAAGGTLRRTRRALRRARSRRGDCDRRFRRLGRRAAGADADRRGRAAAARRAERCRIGGAGFLRRRAARLSALHAARAVWRRAGARRPAVGASCGYPPLATGSRRWEGHGNGAPTCCGSGR